MSDEQRKAIPPETSERAGEDYFDDPAFTAPVKPDDPSMLRLLAARANRGNR